MNTMPNEIAPLWDTAMIVHPHRFWNSIPETQENMRKAPHKATLSFCN